VVNEHYNWSDAVDCVCLLLTMTYQPNTVSGQLANVSRLRLSCLQTVDDLLQCHGKFQRRQLVVITAQINIPACHSSKSQDHRVQTPGYIPKKLGGFFGYTHLKSPPPKNPHFYFNLIFVYTLYSTNNAIIYCF